MKPGQIRPIVVCVFRDGDRILAAEFQDPSSGVQFYRPLGGAIHFGEHSRECIVREIREEMGAEITDLTYVGTMENIFTYDGRPGHEIVLVYEAKLADPRLYEMESLRCQEDDDSEFMAVWKPIACFQAGKAPLYPEGILELLERAKERPFGLQRGL
jgi:8-oxo-dGTP pyrophosphatase MutT (NUDIX family)